MTTINPYAPSKASMGARDQPASGGEGIWRTGKVVVVREDVAMPLRCFKCNEATDAPGKIRKVYWHHPGLYILVVSPIIYIIVAAIVRKTAYVDPGLCARHRKRRRNGIIAAWLLLLSGIALPIFAGSGDAGRISFLLAPLALLAAAVTAIAFGRVTFAKRIDSREVRLGGAGEEFLASLPAYDDHRVRIS